MSQQTRFSRGLPSLPDGEPLLQRWFVIPMIVLVVLGIAVAIWTVVALVRKPGITVAERRPPGTAAVTHTRGQAVLNPTTVTEPGPACASGVEVVGDLGARRTLDQTIAATCQLLDTDQFPAAQQGLGHWFATDGQLRIAVFELTGLESSARVERGSEQGVERGSEQGVERGSEQGVERGSEQGVERGSEQGVERGSEQGVERGSEQGVERGSEQGVERGSEQGVERGSELGTDASKAALDRGRIVVEINPRFQFEPGARAAPMLIHELVHLGSGTWPGAPVTAEQELVAMKAQQTACRLLPFRREPPRGCVDADLLVDSPDAIEQLVAAGYSRGSPGPVVPEGG